MNHGGIEKAMLEIVPMTLKEANAFVAQNHRHHGKVVGHKFSIGLSDGEKIVVIAIVGRPVARHLDDGWTLEVNRLCLAVFCSLVLIRTYPTLIVTAPFNWPKK